MNATKRQRRSDAIDAINAQQRRSDEATYIHAAAGCVLDVGGELGVSWCVGVGVGELLCCRVVVSLCRCVVVSLSVVC